MLWKNISNSQDIHQTPKDLIKDPGQSEDLRCSHSSSYNVMLWYKQKRGESLELLGCLVGSGDRRLSSDDSAVYFCAASTHSLRISVNFGNPAYFGNGTKLTVLGKNICLLVFLVFYQFTDKWSTLVCVATGFYPDHVSVSWKVNGEERQDWVSTDTSAQQDKTTLMYHISSRMKIDDMDWIDPKNNFTCTVHFFNGEDCINVTNTINGQKGENAPLSWITHTHTHTHTHTRIYRRQ
uniref:Ig-like domain-containing protein n=1 Tax=Sinocyclocheilus anshuiensis TaxID=1608454 RepID=A0A671SAT3_9TELE